MPKETPLASLRELARRRLQAPSEEICEAPTVEEIERLRSYLDSTAFEQVVQVTATT
jgi:hypothetical protein